MFELSPEEKERILNYRYSYTDHSFTTRLFRPFWDWTVLQIPRGIVPNWISLTGFFCSFLAYYFHLDYPPLASLFIFSYYHLDALDGKQARRTQSSSPLGELVDHCLDILTTQLLSLILAEWFGLSNWLVISISSFKFLLVHLEAYENCVGNFHIFDVGEALCLLTFFGLIKPWLPVMTESRGSLIYFLLILVLSHMIHELINHSQHEILPIVFYTLIFNYFYQDSQMLLINNGLICYQIAYVLFSKMSRSLPRDKPFWGFPLCWILMWTRLWFLPGLIGYFLSFYLISRLADQLDYSLWRPNLNIYLDGVWDLLHVGHLDLILSARKWSVVSKWATFPQKEDIKEFTDEFHFQKVIEKYSLWVKPHFRILVGVARNEDNEIYKRKQIYSEEIKIKALGWVSSQVIPEAPCLPGSLTEEFIAKHQISLVLRGDDCDLEFIDKFYNVARQKGILILKPYNPLISTSQIIETIKTKLN